MRLLRTVITAAALTLLLVGCSEPDSSGQEFNESDVAFASDMIQHHAQALTMVDLTMGRDLDPEVTALAEEIRAAQAPEIERLADWLQDWDEPVPETSRDHTNAHGGEMAGDADMPGMMSGDDMAALEDAPDGEFQSRWLEMMIEHHEGAVEMAEQQVDEGQHGGAVALAEEIITAQEAEISTMQDLLGG